MFYNRFTAFYGGQHSGRKMNWLYHMSKGELMTNCFKNKYTAAWDDSCSERLEARFLKQPITS